MQIETVDDLRGVNHIEQAPGAGKMEILVTTAQIDPACGLLSTRAREDRWSDPRPAAAFCSSRNPRHPATCSHRLVDDSLGISKTSGSLLLLLPTASQLLCPWAEYALNKLHADRSAPPPMSDVLTRRILKQQRSYALSHVKVSPHSEVLLQAAY